MHNHTKKASNGVVYTPPSIANLLVDMALRQIPPKLVLSGLKVLDPAVGEGALALALYNRLGEKLRIVGIDIDARALRRASKSLAGKAKVELYNYNFLELCENSDQEQVVGANYDLILLNPPYIGEKCNKQLFRKIKSSALGRKFYEGKMDLSYFFIEQSLALLRPAGVLVMITPAYWLNATGARKLRAEIRAKSEIVEILYLEGQSVFPDAPGQHNIITALRRRDNALRDRACCVTRFMRSQVIEQFSTTQTQIYLKDGTIAPSSLKLKAQLDALERRSEFTLGQVASIDCGIQTGADKFTASHKRAFPEIDAEVGAGIFILTLDELKRLKLSSKELQHVKPFFKNSEIGGGVLRRRNERVILYITKDLAIEKLPRIKSHLDKFKPILQRRRECLQGKLPWYSLHWARQKQIFSGLKIVTPQRAKKLKFSLSRGEFFASVDVYFIRPLDKRVSCERLLKILNSQAVETWLKARGKKKGEYMELYADPLSKIPLDL